MSNLAKFKAVYCSGLFIPEPSAVSALSLLFEKIYLPNNLEFVKEFSKRYKIIELPSQKSQLSSMRPLPEDARRDPFEGLTTSQRKNAENYLKWGVSFGVKYKPLFQEIFETNLFSGKPPIDVTLVKQGPAGGMNEYEITLAPLTLVSEDEETFPRLLSQDYVPVVGKFHPTGSISKEMDTSSARALSALLAMKSIQMLIPRTKSVHPEIILEARHRLSNHLPPFWSSMLKLSIELRKRLNQVASTKDMFSESQELVDTIVRPSLIDLQEKMLREKRDWFYKILSPIQTGLRLLIGNPPITQQQLLTSALVLGMDVASSAIDNMRTIEALKREAGLTFLLETEKILNDEENA